MYCNRFPCSVFVLGPKLAGELDRTCTDLCSGLAPARWERMGSLESHHPAGFSKSKLKLGGAGSIPGTWGANGSFGALTALSLYSNFLSGTLPAAYAPLKHLSVLLQSIVTRWMLFVHPIKACMAGMSAWLEQMGIIYLYWY